MKIGIVMERTQGRRNMKKSLEFFNHPRKTSLGNILEVEIALLTLLTYIDRDSRSIRKLA